MRKAFFTLTVIVTGLYLALHLALGSSPVQRRVVEEIRRALSQFGLDLQIESIEFSALTPKIYLNRVTIRSLPNGEIKLPNPLAIDKLKIEFQPLALISKQLVIEEAVLFHPRIQLPGADALYHRIEAMLKEKKKVVVKNESGFTVVLKKIGVVDALFEVSSTNPAFSVRSRSFSAFLQNTANQQQTVTVDSNNLEIERGPLKLNLSKVEVDVDITNKSVRVNRGVVSGEQLSINIKGASSLPEKPGAPITSLNFSYDIRLPLKLLNRVAELKAPEIDGILNSAGALKVVNGTHGGSGTVRYENLAIEGIGIGSGSLAYALNDKRVSLTNLDLRYSEGEVTSKIVTIDTTKESFPIAGELALHNIKLDALLTNLNNPGIPLRLDMDGGIVVSGTAKPLNLVGDTKVKAHDFKVLAENAKGATAENTIISTANAEVEGTLNFVEDRMKFQAKMGILDGKVEADGFIAYENYAKIHVKGDALSLTKLNHIAELTLGGVANINTEIDVVGRDAKVTGAFDVTNGEVQDVFIGPIRGQAFFQNALLSFENLEAQTSLEPVRSHGFLDFNPAHAHYKFLVEGRRVEVKKVFESFKKIQIPFPAPIGGEMSARLSIEGGHDSDGVEIVASGQAKSFSWYSEDWNSSNFSFKYRNEYTELGRLLLFKKSGGLEMRGKFEKAQARLTFLSHGLRLEEMNYLGKSPLTGEIVGQLTLLGDLTNPTGSGDVKLVKSAFRSVGVPDSAVTFQTTGPKVEMNLNLMGETLRGIMARSTDRSGEWGLNLSFEDFDFAPAVTILMGKDIPNLNSVTAAGDLNLSGVLKDWRTYRGSGTLRKLNLGLKGTPMTNQEPFQIRIQDGAVKITHVNLIGKDSQLSGDFAYEPDKSVKSSIDGKVDLQFLQPFIPALEYGTGKVAVGIRISGRPQEFSLLGNVTLEDGTLRLAGLVDEFRNTQAQLSVSQDRINVDKFESTVNGGNLSIDGDVRINRFTSLIPNLALTANRVSMRAGSLLSARFSGDFFIRGNRAPYLLGGKCRISEAALTKFAVDGAVATVAPPVFKFDVSCDGKEKLMVNTEVMDAEFKGNFHLLGDNVNIGVLGTAEAIQGSLIFRQTKFTLNSGTVRFESPTRIAPRFAVAGRAYVKELKSQAAQEYEVNLQVVGTPADYKPILTSSPALTEADITSLLLLGVTSTTRSAEGNFLDLGTAVVGQIPLQSKIESQLGVDIRVNSQANKTLTNSQSSSTVTNAASTGTLAGDVTVPAVQIQKDITKRTKVSYSNTLQVVPTRELRIEHILDDNLTVNGTAVDKLRDGTDGQTVQSYGVDFRYRFQFE